MATENKELIHLRKETVRGIRDICALTFADGTAKWNKDTEIEEEGKQGKNIMEIGKVLTK